MKSSKKFLFALLIFSSCLNAWALGSKRPRPANPAPTPGPAAPVPPKPPTLDFGDKLDDDAYLNTSAQIGPAVDTAQQGAELSRPRQLKDTDFVDQCLRSRQKSEFFSEQISYYASELINDVPSMLGPVGSFYGTSSNDEAYFPTSLIRHPLCFSTAASLAATINKVPGQDTIDKLNRFAEEVNELRAAVLDGDQKAKAALQATWTRLFSCLAYTESLTTADSSSSTNVAQKVAPSGYRRPAGVKFYEDPYQDADSKLNIGLYQFTPNSSGNIRPCLKAWNALHQERPACQVGLKSSKAELIKVLGSSLQSFNAFCGIHKLVQTFSIQVNTFKASATHPDNRINGKFRPEEERCVTPHFQAGKAYNHFGPFQNSTGSNLNKLFTCVEKTR